ncbi:hypothetical protein [Bradyrhizobium sp.]|jgi:hypothetical protein|uniref:hypothetical protein n=1 Tax=Bradyrhizobium sp. TaxID=376 RepID=UPI002E07E3FD|nr:hypothetical protein [Bradyrhizobium sp.]
MAVDQTTTAGTSVTAVAVTANNLLLEFVGMPGNQPASYDNTVFLWQEPQIIPYAMPPLASQAIPINAESGTVDIGNLELVMQPYTAGYAVGPEVTNVCSWVSIAPDGTVTTTFQTSLQLFSLSAQMVSVQYETPAGCQPRAYGHWIGFWEGPSASHIIPPIASVQIAANNSRGNITLEVPNLLSGKACSVGYFMGQKQTTLAASCTFYL